MVALFTLFLPVILHPVRKLLLLMPVLFNLLFCLSFLAIEFFKLGIHKQWPPCREIKMTALPVMAKRSEWFLFKNSLLTYQDFSHIMYLGTAESLPVG